MLLNIVCFSVYLVLLMIHRSSLELVVASIEDLDSDMIDREARLLETFETETECETKKDVHHIYEVIIREDNKRTKTNITIGKTHYIFAKIKC